MPVSPSLLSYLPLPMLSAFAVLLLTPAAVAADAPALGGDVGVAIDSYTLGDLSADGLAETASVIWSFDPPNVLDVRMLDGQNAVFTGPPGTYRVEALWADFDARKMGRAVGVIEVRGPPAPEPDDEDEDEPEPDDEDEDEPDEIVTGPIRVMVIEERQDRPTLDPNQVAVFSSVPVREFLNAHDKPFSDGTPGYRFFDDDFTAEQLAGEPEDVRALYAEAVKGFRELGSPVVLIDRDGTFATAPLPPSPDAMLGLLRTYAGP